MFQVVLGKLNCHKGWTAGFVDCDTVLADKSAMSICKSATVPASQDQDPIWPQGFVVPGCATPLAPSGQGRKTSRGTPKSKIRSRIAKPWNSNTKKAVGAARLKKARTVPATDKQLRFQVTDFAATGDNFVLEEARVVRQPGDGGCLFHSMAYGLDQGFQRGSARSLRAAIVAHMQKNPKLRISETALEDWVKWDAGSTVAAYAQKMARGECWGGGIEMAACSHLKQVNIHVYTANVHQEKGHGGYRRVAQFDHQGADVATDVQTICLLYQGGIHFDALVV